MSKTALSRREFVRAGALAAGVFAAPNHIWALAHQRPSSIQAPPIRLGLASYTFRNFSRAQLIGFMKRLNVLELNAKDVKG
jgi:hypothetical protein